MSRIVGILLAAGQGARFGGDKLLAPIAMPSAGAAGVAPIGVAAALNLIGAIPDSIAVVRPRDTQLAAHFTDAGLRVVPCMNAGDGMSATLACGIAATVDADGWIVALGDMPWIAESTILRVVRAIADGAVVAAPFYGQLRGHPVGFGAACFAELSVLSNDDGAKSVVAAHRDLLVRIDVDDAGTLRDVDRPDDLT